MVAFKNYHLFTSLLLIIFKLLVKGKVIGIKRGSVHDVETVKPNTGFIIALFGTNLWPVGFDSVWLTNADHCEDSFLMNKAVYYLNVIDEFSHKNVLILELKNGIPEDDGRFYRLCTKPTNHEKLTASNIRVSLIAARSMYSMPLPLYAMILLIILMIIMSGVSSGLNLSFTSVAISELNIINRMGDAYQRRLAKNIIPIRRYLNWIISTFAIANAISNCGLSLLIETFLQSMSDGKISFFSITLIICMISVIFGELFPLAICNRRGLYIASKARYITWSTMIVLSPLAWPLSKILDTVLGIQGCEVYDRSKIEFLILEAAKRSSAVFSEIMKNAINLPRIRVGNVMTKIDEAFLLSTTDTLDNKLILSIVEKGYTRIPVYEGSKRSKVIAVLNVKDLIATDFSKGVVVIDVLKKLNYLKQVRFVCEEMQVKPLMNEMEGQNFAFEPKGYISHLAMVMKYDSKSYSLVGLITLDDIIEEIFGEMKDELFQWTNRRIGKHHDQATFDWLRSEPDLVAPLEQIYRIQETLENYPGFKELSFNIHTMRRLFNLSQLHSSTNKMEKLCIYQRNCPSRTVTVMLKGEAFYMGRNGVHISATPFELGVELIEKIYLRCLDKGTNVDLSNLSFIPSENVYVEPPFHYIKITVRAVTEAMKITKVDEYRPEVSEAKHSKMKESMSDTQLSISTSDDQKFSTMKTENKTISTENTAEFGSTNSQQTINQQQNLLH